VSRSYRKTPIFGHTTKESEKDDKRRTNGTLRAAVRRALASSAEIIPTIRDVSNVWSFSKDGKHWYPKGDMRK
jgi:hypothetical protein